MKTVARGVLSRILEVAVRLLPKFKHVVVYGYPQREGNAVETIRALGCRYKGTVYWLDGPESLELLFSETAQLRSIKRLSLHGIWRYTTAEAVFFTHGLYGNPVPSLRQPIVNLWHGDGIKGFPEAPSSRRSIAPATYVVGGTKLLTKQKTIDFKMNEDAVIVTGNPRIDQFRSRPSGAVLHSLGVDAAKPYVVWMPTFRKARSVGASPGWTDSTNIGSELGDQIRQISTIFTGMGIQLVVKPHPLDVESHNIPGCIALRDDQISDAGTTLYQLLGASAGLISDYSSVWTDYLVLNKPIAFLIPDKDDYRRGRGVFPADVVDWLPGIEITDAESAVSFGEEVVVGRGSKEHLRTYAVDRLGVVFPESAANDLLDALESLSVFRKSKSLRPRDQKVTL